MNCGAYMVVIICCLVAQDTSSQGMETSFMDNLNSMFRTLTYSVLGRTSNERGMRNARKLNVALDEGTPFPCNTTEFRSIKRPTSAHKLRPGDFDVIGAIGDSLTAANGAAASAFYHIAVENRGLSWAAGGQGSWREYLSLPNILKVFNPKLTGYSLGDSAAIHKASQFNVAEGGSMSRDMPYMAKVLVKRIKADKRVDFKKDWKLITYMIGANDFCADICYHTHPEVTAEKHRTNLIHTLDYLRDNLPRAIVNVVPPPNIDILMKFKGASVFCELSHVFSCPCIFGRANNGKREKLVPIMRRWQEIDEEVSMDSRYKKTEDFAVILQPFTADLTFPERVTPQGNITEWSLLSQDCFHFSQKGYARASNAIWNNMLEPVGEKSTTWFETYTKFLCPTESSPYIYTWANSGKSANRRQILPR